MTNSELALYLLKWSLVVGVLYEMCMGVLTQRSEHLVGMMGFAVGASLVSFII